nr:DUF488 domain-containing protein [Candidatus Bathyarchaeota archaeon]
MKHFLPSLLQSSQKRLFFPAVKCLEVYTLHGGFTLNEHLSGSTVWTIGTSDRTADEFISILKELGVNVAVDVRRFPTSKFEWFKGENLKKLLADAGIEYVHLEGLGGYRSGGYRKHMKSEVFREAFKELLKLVKGNKVAIFCSEKLFFKCHRRFIADELTRKGVKVIHVVEKGKTRVHRLAGHG